MRPSVCVHAHLYQPPREHPATGEVPLEPSAAPHHDWNHRITVESYEPIAAARVLRDDGDVDHTVNLFEWINFNVGPTLGSWLDRHAPHIVAAMQRGDEASCHRNDGHGGAIAQPFVHAILPLATPRDRDTLIIWGLAEFARRFGRPAEGMWLPETAVDTATLEALAAHGMRFSIVAPHQIQSPNAIDTPRTIDRHSPLQVSLPSGRSISLFAYDGALSHGIAFGTLLQRGDLLAARLTEPVRARGGLSHVATDGETFGHHHKFAEMAVAWALEAIDNDPEVDLTTYGAFLASYLDSSAPVERARLVEDTSWSCEHGLERWRSACGCAGSAEVPFGHAWRVDLRRAVDSVVDSVTTLTDRYAGAALRDPWGARDRYIHALLEPSKLNAFLDTEAVPGARSEAGAWLRAHEHLLLAQSSCGWFFDEFDGLESLLVLRQLAAATATISGLTPVDLDREVAACLAPVRAATGSGLGIWERVTRE